MGDPVPVPGPRKSQPSYPTSPLTLPRPEAPPPAQSRPAFTPGPSDDFADTLARYRTALLNAKAKGDEAAQTQAALLQEWLDTQLRSLQSNVATTRGTIQSFVDEYAGSTSDIDEVRRAFRSARERGPVLQDVYETDKRKAEAEKEGYNLVPLYSKSALIVGLAVVAGVLWRRM